MKTATVDQPHLRRNFENAMKKVFSLSKAEIVERERKHKQERSKRKGKH